MSHQKQLLHMQMKIKDKNDNGNNVTEENSNNNVAQENNGNNSGYKSSQ